MYVGRDRWVDYKRKDYDASQIPPEWYVHVVLSAYGLYPSITIILACCSQLYTWLFIVKNLHDILSINVVD